MELNAGSIVERPGRMGMKGRNEFAGSLSVLIGFLIYTRTHMSPTSMSLAESSQHGVEYNHDSPLAAPPLYFSQMTRTDWISAVSAPTILFESANHCVACTISAETTRSNSSPQDLILGVSLGTARNALTFVRSLRSTGSRATCCLIVDDKFYESCTSFMLQAFRSCGLSLINIGSFSPEYAGKAHNARFLLYYQFLYKFNRHFHRAILVDPLETVFQTDPFTADFDAANLSIGSECVTYNESEWEIRPLH